MILVDSSVLIQLFRANPTAESDMHKLIAERLALSVIVIAEIQLGFSLSPHTKTKTYRQEFDSFVNQTNVTVFPVDQSVAETYATLQGSLKKKGQQLGQFDALIAATALANDLPLFTYDDDFKRVPGLRLFQT